MKGLKHIARVLNMSWPMPYDLIYTESYAKIEERFRKEEG